MKANNYPLNYKAFIQLILLLFPLLSMNRCGLGNDNNNKLFGSHIPQEENGNESDDNESDDNESDDNESDDNESDDNNRLPTIQPLNTLETANFPFNSGFTPKPVSPWNLNLADFVMNSTINTSLLTIHDDPREQYYGTLANPNSQLKSAVFNNDCIKIERYLKNRKERFEVYHHYIQEKNIPLEVALLFYEERKVINLDNLAYYVDIANPYKDYGHGNTVLHLALQRNNWDAALVLLEHAVDNQERRINIPNQQGETALHLAARTGNAEGIINIFQVLLMNGIHLNDKVYIDLDYKDNTNKTFLDYLPHDKKQQVLSFIAKTKEKAIVPSTSK